MIDNWIDLNKIGWYIFDCLSDAYGRLLFQVLTTFSGAAEHMFCLKLRGGGNRSTFQTRTNHLK